MLLTLESLIETVRQELGRDPGKSTFEALINEAGEHWVNAHQWLYLRDRTQDIQLEAGVGEYVLGSGVRSIGKELYRPDSVWKPIPVMGYREWLEERSRYLAASTQRYTPLASTRWDTQEGDTRPRLYLEVFPAEVTERVVIQYQAGWLPLDSLDDVADIPAPVTAGFREWVRRYAMGREKDRFDLDQEWVKFMRGPVGMGAKVGDAQSAGSSRAAPGGVGRHYERGRPLRDLDIDRYKLDDRTLGPYRT